MKKKKNRFLISVLVLLVLTGGAAYGAYTWWRWTEQAVGGRNKTRVTVAEGATPASVGEELERRRVIRSARGFALRARRTTIKPGVYDVSSGESPAQILRRLAEGDIATTKVTFPEGFTLRQIARRLDDRKAADDEKFLTLATQRGSTLRASFRPPARLEGYLFPDTYTFPVGADEQDIAQQMLGQFDRQVARGKDEQLRRSKYTLPEIVVIASLIEREAKVPQDRARIAGVIYNRLARKMPLQIDATVQYARGQHKERLLFKDLEVDSPYNTYRRVGLPSGPICNPGKASIEAALSPERHPYLYYVARSDGSHLFGRTLAEHNHNIALALSGRRV